MATNVLSPNKVDALVLTISIMNSPFVLSKNKKFSHRYTLKYYDGINNHL
jgi:hypothetical protein